MVRHIVAPFLLSAIFSRGKVRLHGMQIANNGSKPIRDAVFSPHVPALCRFPPKWHSQASEQHPGRCSSWHKRPRRAQVWFVVIDKPHRLLFPARREQQLRLPGRRAPVFSAFLLQIQDPSAPFPGDCTTLQALKQLELRGSCSLSHPHLLRQKKNNKKRPWCLHKLNADPQPGDQPTHKMQSFGQTVLLSSFRRWISALGTPRGTHTWKSASHVAMASRRSICGGDNPRLPRTAASPPAGSL